MKHIVLILLVLVMGIESYSRNDTLNKRLILNIGVNRLGTAFILRNGMNNIISDGWGGNLTFSKPGNSHRISTQYSHYKQLDMDPVWKNVNAHKMELNLEIVTHFDNIELLLYPFLGLSYNYISAIYTGKNDPDALARFYPINSVVTNRWLGLTGGLGLERSIKRFTIFGNYRMHIVKAEEAVRIMDIGLDAGLKYQIDLKLKKRKKTTQAIPEKKRKQNHRSIFKRLKMPNDRYDLN